MKYKKTLPYTLKLTAAIGLPLLLGACNKTEPEPQHDVVIELDGGNGTELDRVLIKYDVDAIKKLDHDKTVRYIYLTPISTWGADHQTLCMHCAKKHYNRAWRHRQRFVAVAIFVPTPVLWPQFRRTAFGTLKTVGHLTNNIKNDALYVKTLLFS